MTNPAELRARLDTLKESYLDHVRKHGELTFGVQDTLQVAYDALDLYDHLAGLVKDLPVFPSEIKVRPHGSSWRITSSSQLIAGSMQKYEATALAALLEERKTMKGD